MYRFWNPPFFPPFSVFWPTLIFFKSQNEHCNKHFVALNFWQSGIVFAMFLFAMTSTIAFSTIDFCLFVVSWLHSDNAEILGLLYQIFFDFFKLIFSSDWHTQNQELKCFRCEKKVLLENIHFVNQMPFRCLHVLCVIIILFYLIQNKMCHETKGWKVVSPQSNFNRLYIVAFFQLHNK